MQFFDASELGSMAWMFDGDSAMSGIPESEHSIPNSSLVSPFNVSWDYDTKTFLKLPTDDISAWALQVVFL